VREREGKKEMGSLLRWSHNVILSPFVFKRTTTTVSTDSSQTVSSDAIATNSPGESPTGTNCRLQRGGGEQQNRRFIHSNQSPSQFNRKRNSVSFGRITVREYHRSLGDCWDVAYGLGIGWDYYEHASTPIPDNDQDEAIRYVGKLRRNMMKKVKSKITTMLLVNRNKMLSNGEIKAESIKGFGTKQQTKTKLDTTRKSRMSKRKKSLHYEDQPCTTSIRKQLLQEFGYPTSELTLSESERVRLLFEYNMWMTRPIKKMSSLSTSSSNDDRPSKLLIDRVLADILQTIPDSATTVPSGCTTDIISTSTKTTTTATTSCCTDRNWTS